MNAFKYPAVVTVAAALVAAGPSGTASAANNGTLVPMISRYKTCDFQLLPWVSAVGTGSGDAVIAHDSDTVTADVRLATAQPHARYTVRLIQVPRSSATSCSAGAPGVAAGEMFTDGVGSATITVRDAPQAGATGAWVAIDGPVPAGQAGNEFYTSEVLASLR
jgi:hypothetical protein